jgi:hypothetical protein
MIRRTTTLGIVLTLIAGVAQAASQAPAPTYAKPGPYVEVAGLAAFETFRGVAGLADVDNTLGAQFKGGYKFLSWLSAEAQFDIRSDFELEFDVPGPADDDRFELGGGVFTANARFDLPERWSFPLERLKPFAVVGVGAMWADLRPQRALIDCTEAGDDILCTPLFGKKVDEAAFTARFGGGVDFYVFEKWALTLDATYVLPTGKLEDLRYVSLGWGVRMDF